MDAFANSSAILKDENMERKAKYMKSGCILGLLLIAFTINGCRSENQSYSTDYSVAVMQTMEYKEKTDFMLFDDQLRQVGEYRTSYPNVAYDGFCNSTVYGGKLYINPMGHADERDYGRVVEIDLKDGTAKEYSFDRINIVDIAYKDNRLYAVSNLNGVCYLDVMDCETGEISTIETDTQFITTITPGDSDAYGIGVEFETDMLGIYEIDFEEKTVRKLYECDPDHKLDYLVYSDGNLYFVLDGLLTEYEVKTDRITTYQLPHSNAYNLLLQDEELYIGCTDIFSNAQSFVDRFDLKTKEITGLLETDGAILQMEVSQAQDRLYLLGRDQLVQYALENDTAAEKNRVTLTPEGDYYIGGFFLNEKNLEEKENEK